MLAGSVAKLDPADGLRTACRTRVENPAKLNRLVTAVPTDVVVKVNDGDVALN